MSPYCRVDIITELNTLPRSLFNRSKLNFITGILVFLKMRSSFQLFHQIAYLLMKVVFVFCNLEKWQVAHCCCYHCTVAK